MPTAKDTTQEALITPWDLWPEDQDPASLESSLATSSKKDSESLALSTAREPSTALAMSLPTNHIHITCFSGADHDDIKDFIECIKLVFEPQALLYNMGKQEAVKLKMLMSNLSGEAEDYHWTLDREDC